MDMLLPRRNSSREDFSQEYINLVLYLLERANDANLGTKKLFKLLYFIDFDYYEKHQQPITGTVYEAEKFGPIPFDGYAVLREMTRRKLIKPWGTRIGIYNYKRFLALQKADTSEFNGDELEHIDFEIKRFSHHTGADIEAEAKADIPYQATKASGEKRLDYDLVFYRTPASIRSEGEETNEQDKIIIGSEPLKHYLSKLAAIQKATEVELAE